jgi:23S rRNA pseudouridine955/2504/2580 synthase
MIGVDSRRVKCPFRPPSRASTSRHAAATIFCLFSMRTRSRAAAGPQRHFVVPRQLHGSTSSDILERWLPGVHRAALRRLLRDGLILVNGTVLEVGHRLRDGDLLTLAEDIEIEDLPVRPNDRTRPKPAPAVLYEDPACLALDKPPGLTTVPSRQVEASVHGSLERWFGPQDLRIVHRLDRETSGVLLLAKGLEAARALDKQFRARSVDKAYLALVRGVPPQDEMVCELSIGPGQHGSKVRLGDFKRSRQARTTFQVLRRWRDYALVEARPVTGRMHQVRAHLMALGYPLIVDPLYAGRDAFFLSEIKPDYRLRRGQRETPLLPRTPLHAKSLRFVSPAGGASVLVEAPLPKDMAVVIARFDELQDPRSATAPGRWSEP